MDRIAPHVKLSGKHKEAGEKTEAVGGRQNYASHEMSGVRVSHGNVSGIRET